MTKHYYWPALMGLIGSGLCVGALWVFAQAFGGWSTSIQGPGSVALEIPAAGDYRLWHESKTTIGGRLHVVDDELPAGSVVEFTDASGAVIALQVGGGSLSQEIGNTRRWALGRIEIPESGSYTVSLSGFDAPRIFHLSEIRFMEHFLRALLLGLPGVLLAMAGLIWAVVVAASSRGSHA